MARSDVRNLVCHHSRQFRFVVSRQNQPGIHKEEAARKSKRVHLVRVDDLNGEGDLRVGIAHDVLSHSVHVFRDHRIGDYLRRLLDLLGILLAHRDLLVEVVPVADAASASDVAIADGIEIANAAVVIVGIGIPIGCRRGGWVRPNGKRSRGRGKHSQKTKNPFHGWTPIGIAVPANLGILRACSGEAVLR